jgi:hypothetical protein
MFLTHGVRFCRGGEKAKDCLACWNNWDQDQVTGEVKFHREQNKKFDAILRPHVMWWWPGFYVFPFMRTDVVHKLQRYVLPVQQKMDSIQIMPSCSFAASPANPAENVARLKFDRVFFCFCSVAAGRSVWSNGSRGARLLLSAISRRAGELSTGATWHWAALGFRRT